MGKDGWLAALAGLLTCILAAVFHVATACPGAADATPTEFAGSLFWCRPSAAARGVLDLEQGTWTPRFDGYPFDQVFARGPAPRVVVEPLGPSRGGTVELGIRLIRSGQPSEPVLVALALLDGRRESAPPPDRARPALFNGDGIVPAAPFARQVEYLAYRPGQALRTWRFRVPAWVTQLELAVTPLGESPVRPEPEIDYWRSPDMRQLVERATTPPS